MLERLYVHNFRCLENFELTLKNMRSALLIGKNGSGKSTIGVVLEILQSIGRGTNRVGDLIQTNDFARGRSDVPIRFEIEICINNILYKYVIALELPENFKELRIRDEQLEVSGKLIYSRQEAIVTLHNKFQKNETSFIVDWHLIALPVIQNRSEEDPLHIFKSWLAHMIILTPIPVFMHGESKGETLELKRDGSNCGEWFTGLLAQYPAAYTSIDKYLKMIMPDLKDFRNEVVGKDFKIMSVHFQEKNANTSVYFKDLSDGEKCFFLCAVVLAANQSYGPLFCFWDEPDNFLSLSEVGHFTTSLRRSFDQYGQFLATSHNSETIRKFSNENTFIIHRKNHIEPSLIRLLSDLSFSGDLVDTLIRGDIEL
ncbi:ATPase AAA-type core domain-containing protein [Candidatus Magnetomoraceae bacterium gMMP-1]